MLMRKDFRPAVRNRRMTARARHWSTSLALAGLLVLPSGCAAQSSAQSQAAPRGGAAPTARATATGFESRPWRNEDFRLGPGDRLRVDVFRDEQMSQNLQVRPDGKITLPQVGDITAAGLTPQELATAVTAELKTFIVDPVVTVIVQEATSAQVHVVGEVGSPGSIVMHGPMDALTALAQAGWLKEFADKGGIHIQRMVGDRMQKIDVDYKRLMRGEGEPVFLQPGDRLVVP